MMKININNLVSISEANQNFSKVARLVDESGAVVILKNNAPKYILVNFSVLQDEQVDENKHIEEVIQNILDQHTKEILATLKK